MSDNDTMTEETLTLRIGKADRERLAELARYLGQTEEEVAAGAVLDLLAFNDQQIAGIQAAIESIDRGETISGEAVKAWLDSWGTDNELPPPVVGQ